MTETQLIIQKEADRILQHKPLIEKRDNNKMLLSDTPNTDEFQIIVPKNKKQRTKSLPHIHQSSLATANYYEALQSIKVQVDFTIGQ